MLNLLHGELKKDDKPDSILKSNIIKQSKKYDY